MLPSPNSTVTIVDDKARAEEEFEMADANRSARLHMTSWTPNESEHLGTPGTPSRPGAPIGPYWKREARAPPSPRPARAPPPERLAFLISIGRSQGRCASRSRRRRCPASRRGRGSR